MMPTIDVLKEQINCVLGRKPCELRLINARLVELLRRKTIDLKGAFVAPGFIDAHVHIESGMLSPIQFARLIAPCGTTTIIADPHEIANVQGLDGIRFMMNEAKKAEINIR